MFSAISWLPRGIVDRGALSGTRHTLRFTGNAGALSSPQRTIYFIVQ